MNKLNLMKRDLKHKPRILREMGVVPGNIYGGSIKNTPIQVKEKELRDAFVSPSSIFKVQSPGGREVYVRIDNMKRDPVSGQFLHFSLVQLPRGKKNEADVALNFKGHPIGVKKGGALIILQDEIRVEAEPRNIPRAISKDISDLDIGEKITVEDINLKDSVDILNPDDQLVAFCQPPASTTVLSDEDKPSHDETKLETTYSGLAHPA